MSHRDEVKTDESSVCLIIAEVIMPIPYISGNMYTYCSTSIQHFPFNKKSKARAVKIRIEPQSQNIKKFAPSPEPRALTFGSVSHIKTDATIFCTI
jgi:hypothetical protein